jgi:two-component system sensor histidine kinase CpxA
VPRSGFRFSLSRQLLLWTLLYFAFVVGLPIWLVKQKLGFGWRALLDGEVGDPVFSYLTNFEPELQAAASLKDIDALLKEIAAHTHMDVQIAAGRQGERFAGTTFNLPEEIIRIYSPPGGERGGPPGDGPPDGGRKGPPSTERIARKAQEYFGETPPKRSEERPRLPEGERPRGRLGNKVQGYVSRRPEYYWIVFRIGIPSPEDSILPRQPAMILRTASPWTALGNLDLAPIWWPLAMIGAGSLLFWTVPLWWHTRRLHLATVATERIAAGEFDTRISPGIADEIGRLALSINELGGRLAKHASGQRRFIGDVAHEITAPLARLQFAVGILAENAERDPALRPAAENVYRELASTLALVDELLAYARSGLTNAPPLPVPLALRPLLARLVAEENVGARTTLTVPESLQVRTDPKLLERALSNLVRNFHRHTPADATLAITASAAGDSVTLTFADTGPGVPPELLAQIGEPFFRAQAATPDQPGHGLGLAIVRTCVSASGGTVIFRNGSPHGFAAEIMLPAA